jgi:adenylosuccinate lyase
MTEPASTGGLDNPEIALDRQVEALTQRFPDLDPAELRALVHETYDRLKDEAAVHDHLVAMTENQVTEQLRERGETVHVRGTEPGTE